MNGNNAQKKKQVLNRTQIARTVFAAAESMGIADREAIEQLTVQVIKRLEKSEPLPESEQHFPGMEELVPKSLRGMKQLPSGLAIPAVL